MKLIKVHKKMLNTKYQSSNPSSFREKNLEVGFLCSYVPTCDPRGEASFDPAVRPVFTPRASYEQTW